MKTTPTNRSRITDENPGDRTGAILVAAGPVLLTAALLWHPPLPGRLPDNAGVAEAASAGITRWGLAHVAAALASGAVAVAFVAVRRYLRERGDGSASAVGLGLVLYGSVLFALLPGMEFAVVAALETGADLAETQTALESWFVPILVVGAVTFAFGTVLFAVAVTRAALFARLPTIVIAGALVVFGLTRAVPFGVVQFYVQSVAALVALLPLAVAMSTAGHGAGIRRPTLPDDPGHEAAGLAHGRLTSTSEVVRDERGRRPAPGP